MARSPMADMGDDMNATPLAKLPAPVLQSKTSQAPLEAPNYRDLLTDLDQSSRHRQSPVEPPPQQPPPQYDQQYLQPQQAQAQAQAQQQMMYSPQQEPPPLQGFPTHPTWPTQAYAPQRPPSPSRRPALAAPPKSVAWRLLLANKTPLIVVVILFLALVFAVPRMVRVGRLATAEGRLNVLGAVALSVTAGGVFKLATAVS